MQRLNKKQTVSDSSALHTELLSSPGPLAKELQYVGADVKQSVITDKNIIPESTRQVQQQNSVNRTKSNSMVGQNAPHALKVKSMTELYDTVYPPSKPVVEGLLYNGTYLFVGAPKVGKSFFMAQLGYHVSKGIPLWNYPVTQGAVLYLALEDTEERLQKRLARMFGVEDSENYYFAVEAETLNTGLEEQLNQFVEQHKDARLIIIDTLQKVKEIGGDKFSYADDYQNVTRLKAFSDMVFAFFWYIIQENWILPIALNVFPVPMVCWELQMVPSLWRKRSEQIIKQRWKLRDVISRIRKYICSLIGNIVCGNS